MTVPVPPLCKRFLTDSVTVAAIKRLVQGRCRDPEVRQRVLDDLEAHHATLLSLQNRVLTALMPATPAERIAILTKLANHCQTPQRDEGEWRQFWADYHEDLHNVPARVLAEICRYWRQEILRDEPFFPTSSALRLVCAEKMLPLMNLKADLDRIMGLIESPPAIAAPVREAMTEAEVDEVYRRNGLDPLAMRRMRKERRPQAMPPPPDARTRAAMAEELARVRQAMKPEPGEEQP